MQEMERNLNKKEEEIEKEREALGIIQGKIPEGIPVQPINQYNAGPQLRKSSKPEIMGIDVIRGDGPKLKPKPGPQQEKAKLLQGNFDYPTT